MISFLFYKKSFSSGLAQRVLRRPDDVPGRPDDPGGARMAPWRFGPKRSDPRDLPDPPIVTTGRSPGRADPSFLAIKLQGTLPAAGPGFTRISFYTGFTKKANSTQNYVKNSGESWLSVIFLKSIENLWLSTINLFRNLTFSSNWHFAGGIIVTYDDGSDVGRPHLASEYFLT